MALRWLDPARITLVRDPRGLTLCADGATTCGLVPVVAFPASALDGPVSLRRGATVAMIEEPARLDAASRAALAEALAEQVFAPEVLEVLALDYVDNTYAWHIRTVAGERAFRTRQSYHQLPVVRLADGALELVADDGVRYRIPDVTRLDATSRAKLAPVL